METINPSAYEISFFFSPTPPSTPLVTRNGFGDFCSPPPPPPKSEPTVECQPKSVNCAQLLREGYITHNILPMQRLISGGSAGKKRGGGQTFLETAQYITVTLGGCVSYISPCRGVSSARSHRRDPHCTLSKIDGVS